jgi:hypothetical protein
MNTSVAIKRQMVKESIESQCNSFIEEKIDRYLEVEHQWIIGGHYFARASSECIYLYRDGYFIGAVMMSAWALATLPKGTVIQRLTGDPPRNELVAPDWSLDKRQTIAMIQDRIKNV